MENAGWHDLDCYLADKIGIPPLLDGLCWSEQHESRALRVASSLLEEGACTAKSLFLRTSGRLETSVNTESRETRGM